MEEISVSIERVGRLAYEEGKDFFVVTVVRLSDGLTIVRDFSWRWRARRFARSNMRIARAFIEEEKIVTNFGREL